MLGQGWAFQLICMVAGVGFALSRRSIWGTLLKLSVYLATGVLMNSLAKLYRDQSLSLEIYHMWFIVGLGFDLLSLALLKPRIKQIVDKHTHISQQRQNAESVPVKIGYICGFLLFLVGLEVLFQTVGKSVVTEVLPSISDASPKTKDIPVNRLMIGISSCTRAVCISLLWPQGLGALFDPSYMPFFVSLNSYMRVALFPNHALSHAIKQWEFCLLGLLVQTTGVRHRQLIGQYVHRYWFFLILLCYMLSMPGENLGVMELRPPQDTSIRLRYASIEYILVCSWILVGDKAINVRIFSEDRCEWFSSWGLLMFLFHVPVLWILQHHGMGSAYVPFLFGMAVPCWARRKCADKRVLIAPDEQSTEGCETGLGCMDSKTLRKTGLGCMDSETPLPKVNEWIKSFSEISESASGHEPVDAQIKASGDEGYEESIGLGKARQSICIGT
jgi:hypothetical protein